MKTDYEQYLTLENANQDILDRVMARKFEIHMCLPSATMSERLAFNKELKLMESVIARMEKEESLFDGFIV